MTVGRVEDAPSQIVLQFVGTFGIWLLADASLLVANRDGGDVRHHRGAEGGRQTARLRVPSFAVWETVVFVLNVLAFVMIGLQVRPILSALEPLERQTYIRTAVAVLIVVVAVRAAWVLSYVVAARWKARHLGPGKWPGQNVPSIRGGLVIIWCGMRGIVTLAAAYALPDRVPYRDLIVLCAFGVVAGTLILQGLTLTPFIRLLRLRPDRSTDKEVSHAEERLAEVAIEVLDGDHSVEARALRHEFMLARGEARAIGDVTRPAAARSAPRAYRRRAAPRARLDARYRRDR